MIDADELATLALFAGVARDALERAARSAGDVRADPGEYLVHEGEVCQFYVLLSGKAELTKRFRHLEPVLVVRETPGDYFGEIPILLATTSICNFRAVERSRFMCLDPEGFRQLFQAAPAFASTVVRSVAERLTGVGEFAAAQPQPSITVVGRCLEFDCHELRDFLLRLHVPYDFLGVEEVAARDVIGAATGDGPFVRLCDGAVLERPTLRDLARSLDIPVEAAHDAYDVAIVGGGPAGLAAAVYGASEGLRTVLFERDAPGGQAGTSSRIENYLGFPTGLSGDDLAARAVAQAKRFGAELVVTREVVGIEPGDATHRIVLDGGDAIVARAVVIASGVSWRTLAVDGLDRFVGAGVYYGAARSEAATARGTDVYLVGGGNSAGQAAMFFANHARTVTLLVRGGGLERTMSAYLVEQLASRENVRCEAHSEVVAAYGNGRLEAIDVLERTTGRRSRRETGALFVLIGADARTAWLPDAIARDDGGYVLTGAALANHPGVPSHRDAFFLETSAAGIFAAGDVRAFSVKRCAAGVGEGSMAIALVHQYLQETALAAR